MTYRADLHCHSIYSDGSLTPIELIELAKKNGLSGLSITDHDTLNAYSKDVYAAAKALDIDLFTGVEFSARFEDINVHILGYGVELTPGILSFCKEHLNSRNERNALIIKKLRSLSFVISEKELYQGKKQTVIGRPHIATLMVQKIAQEGGSENGLLTDERDIWEQTNIFARSVTSEELLDPKLELRTLLFRLFQELGVYVQQPRAIIDKCRCSKDKVETMLRSINKDELQSLVDENGYLVVDCEFCKKRRIFSPDLKTN